MPFSHSGSTLSFLHRLCCIDLTNCKENVHYYHRYSQGKDDLRQDAVMQQVFGMVNQLLKENKETKKRELRIRTYKVVHFLMILIFKFNVSRSYQPDFDFINVFLGYLG